MVCGRWARVTAVWRRSVLLLALMQIGWSQSPPSAPSPSTTGSDTAPADESTEEENPKRLFGILPNYRAVNIGDKVAPLTAKHKLNLARKDATDVPVFITTSVFAGLYQAQNLSPSYGHGIGAYPRYYAAALGDSLLSTFMQEGVGPSLFHSDPRYFRLGRSGGSNMRRARYALTRVLVTRTDRGTASFNYAEIAGTSMAVAASNIYADPATRDVATNIQKFGIAIGVDACLNLVREFGPDISVRRKKK